MTMKNESKINRGTRLQFPTICPTISDIKNLHINEYDFGESLQNGRKNIPFSGKMLEKMHINEGDFGVKILFVCHGSII